MKSITQKHCFGCGAACVAFALDKTYEQTVKCMGVDASKKTGYGCHKLCKSLNASGRRYRFKKFKTELNHLLQREDTIVFIEKSLSYPYGHYLCYGGGSWMDPWINLPEDNNLKSARSGFRESLPGNPQFIIFESH